MKFWYKLKSSYLSCVQILRLADARISGRAERGASGKAERGQKLKIMAQEIQSVDYESMVNKYIIIIPRLLWAVGEFFFKLGGTDSWRGHSGSGECWPCGSPEGDSLPFGFNNEETSIEFPILASFMHKNRAAIENLGNFSLKILGIFVSLPQKFEIYVLSKTYRGCNWTETEVIWSSACGRTKVLWKDNHVYVISE